MFNTDFNSGATKRSLILTLLSLTLIATASRAAEKRPNIFIAISDDQSWPHCSAYGSKMVQTPAFDRIAAEGVLFTQAFCASPGCSPSRAALLTGLNTWQLEHAGTHGSYFDKKYVTFPERLAEAGYFVGSCGKGWGPGDYKKLGRSQNPAGRQFSSKGAKQKGYAGSLERFLAERPTDAPFCFWFGSSDPHRGYKKGSGLAKGKKLADAEVPPFLPDTPEIRSDLLDYTFEVERFDDDVQKMITLLQEAGEFENTLFIVTSDNGFPVPRAKANCYEYGIHMPLAVRWGKRIPAQRVVDDLVGFTDLTATIYETAKVDPPQEMSLVGKSLLSLLTSDKSGVVEPDRTEIFSARERHSSSRFNTLGYPQRCIRTRDYLYIRNFEPQRWPAGPAQKFSMARYSEGGELLEGQLGPPHGGYHDIDACPTLDYLIEHRAEPEIAKYLDLAVGRRPAEELFDIRSDPGCLENLAGKPEFAKVQSELHVQLNEYLTKTDDARVSSDGDVWETYPRATGLRWFPKPDWAKQDPDSIPAQPWVDKRRPQK